MLVHLDSVFGSIGGDVVGIAYIGNGAVLCQELVWAFGLWYVWEWGGDWAAAGSDQRL